MRNDADIDLIVQSLRDRGHIVGKVIPLPDNAGDYEFSVDDRLLSLSEVRIVLQEDAERQTHRRSRSQPVDPQGSDSLKS